MAVRLLRCCLSRSSKLNQFRLHIRLIHSMKPFCVVEPSRSTVLRVKAEPQSSVPIKVIIARELHLSGTVFGKNENPGNGDKNQGDEHKLATAFGVWFSSTAVAIFIYLILNSNSEKDQNNVMTLTVREFLEELLPSGEVSRIYLNASVGNHSALVQLEPGAVFRGQNIKNPVLKITGIKNVDEFESVVRDVEKNMGLNPTDRVQFVQSDVDPGRLATFLLGFFAIFLLASFLFSRFRINVRRGGNFDEMSEMMGMSSTSALNKKVVTGIKFSDVAGCTEAKQEVMEFVHYLKHPEKYQKLGAKMPRGCLLTGPPGVGKTLLAKAVATEAEVPFLSKAGSDFVEMIGGLGARRVRDLFKEARSVAPCIVYIDELDAVGAKRSAAESSVPTGSSERDQTLNQILVEMDGILSSAHNVIVMGSTNRVDMLDKALLRPGRFDRHIAMDLPTKIERKAIFEIHLKNLKLKLPYTTYSERLSNLSPGMSGADIANICNEAAICAAREKSTFIHSEHFEQAFERVLAGSKKKSSALSFEERKIIAVHEAGHALVGWMLKHTDALIKVSIVPRTKSALGFTRTLPKEHKLYTRPQLMDIMSMKLAGRAAENLFFGSVTQGAEDDLKKVTDIAYSQVKYLGLNPAIGNIAYPQQDESYIKPYSDALAAKMDTEVKKTVYEAHKQAHDILEANRDKLNILAEELLKHEVLNYDDIVRLIGLPPHGDKLQVQNIEIGSFEPNAV